MSVNDEPIFGKKTLSDIFKDAYDAHREKRAKIDLLVDTLRPLIKTPNDAAVLVPLIAEYLDVSVKNDTNLVRMTQVIQRLKASEMLAAGASGGNTLLTDDEKEALLSNIRGGLLEADKKIEAGITVINTSVQTAAADIAPQDEESDEEDV